MYLMIFLHESSVKIIHSFIEMNQKCCRPSSVSSKEVYVFNTGLLNFVLCLFYLQKLSYIRILVRPYCNAWQWFPHVMVMTLLIKLGLFIGSV
jgi:hypothetical protein